MALTIWTPYIAPGASAECLDDDTLAEQIRAVALVLQDSYEQQPSDPKDTMLASRMWAGFPLALAIRGMVFAEELSIKRNRTDLVPQDDLSYIMSAAKELEEAAEPRDDPPWMGDPDVHRSHRSNLDRQKLVSATEFPSNPPKMPLLWPQLTQDDPRGYRLRLSSADTILLARRLRALPPWLRYDKNKREVLPA